MWGLGDGSVGKDACHQAWWRKRHHKTHIWRTHTQTHSLPHTQSFSLTHYSHIYTHILSHLHTVKKCKISSDGNVGVIFIKLYLQSEDRPSRMVCITCPLKIKIRAELWNNTALASLLWEAGLRRFLPLLICIWCFPQKAAQKASSFESTLHENNHFISTCEMI